MERIEQQQLIKNAIPAICEPRNASASDAEIGRSACQWLSSAMAIWLRDEDLPAPRATREDTPVSRAAR